MAPKPKPKPSPKQKDGREIERRKTILRAAIEVFAKKGYHGCRIADVAREAGVAYGLVYHYFEDKEALLQSVFESGWGGFVTRVREVARGEGTLAEKVQGVITIAFEAYRLDPRAVKVLILEIGRGGRVNRGSAFLEIIELSAEMFTEARGKGELREGVDPILAASLLFGAIEMGLTAFVVGLFDRKDPAALESARAQVADSFLRGVLADAAAEVAWTRSGTRLSAAKRA
jgi:TetR/AcrR family transcriptional regulator, fatty acid metabolism regulator protein